MRRPLLACLLVLSACPRGSELDSGMVEDAGPEVPCDSPEDCHLSGLPQSVCRQSFCTKNVPCADDLECGLAEACLDRKCSFVGCTQDADCPTGHCIAQSLTCVECAASSDCPFNRPICQASAGKCVECLDDTQCGQPGPAHCEALSGACLHCLTDEHCPNGLTCSGGTCVGSGPMGPCPMGTSCAEGLTCVTLGGNPVCLQNCIVYNPDCPTGQICYTLKYSASNSYVFDMGGLLGVCFTPVQNARNYRDSCTLNAMGVSNCQPSLSCTPDSLGAASCRSYCDPGALGACPSPEVCHHFSGDFNGRQFGLCYADNGYGDKCTGDSKCRPGQSCQPYPDPAVFIDELSPACQFNVGSAPALAPCATGLSADGGNVGPDRVCQTGACRSDTTQVSPWFCFASCVTDNDCSVLGRTGSCDGTYDFVNANGDDATLTGCRPGCRSNASCAEYEVDAGFVCRPRLVTGSINSGLKLNCGRPNVSGLPAGAACIANSQCALGFCSFDDARGVRRTGYCLEPCQSAADCPVDDGGSQSGPLDCLPTTFLGYKGLDFRAGTPDDVLSVRSVCSGIACDEDEDCSPDAGPARCAPDVSPLDAGAYVLRCRPAVLAAVKEAGAVCTADSECRSGACGTLMDNSKVCFKACESVAGLPCPSGLTCRAGGFRFTSTVGTVVTLDGCAP